MAETSSGKTSTFYHDELLIQFDDGFSDERSLSAEYEFINSTEIKDAEQSIRQQTQKLCGFLNNYEKSIVKTFKTRWFVYAENTCKLLYYRSPDDFVPLGDIDISIAVFNIDLSNNNKPGLFEINTPAKQLHLEARDQQTALYWLQELQKHRRQYSERKTLTQPHPSTLERNDGGLASQGTHEVSRDDDITLLPRVEVPLGAVGADAAHYKHGWSFAALGSELKNTMNYLKPSKDTYGVAGANNTPSNNNNAEQTNVQKRHNNKDSNFAKLKSKLSPSGRKSDMMDISDPMVDQPDIICQRCKQLQSYVKSQQQDSQELKEEVEAHKEMVKLLQKQIDMLTRERQNELVILSTPEASCSAIVNEKERLVVELEHLLAATRQEKEQITAKLRQVEMEAGQLQEHRAMLEEMLQAKDSIVVQLTDKLYSYENKKNVNDKCSNCAEGLLVPVPLPETSQPPPQTHTPDLQTELGKLTDLCHGYEMQNKLLNKELLELNQLRGNDAARETMLTLQYTEAEAKFYQLQSKHLSLLKEIEKPQRGGETSQSEELVSRLLQDAIEVDGHNNRTQSMSNPVSVEYDQFGFRSLPFDAEDALEVKASSLQRRSDELQNKVKNLEIETSNKVKWENYMVGLGQRELARSPDLKALVRAGIATEYRHKVWKFCVQYHVGRKRERCGAGHYGSLCTKRRGSPKINPAAKQIELDLLRTLPNNKHYENLDSEGIPKLRRVLLAYSQHNPMIGYCQGLNRLVAIALLFLSEEDAFWALVTIVERLMPADYFSKTLIAAQVDQRVLKDLMNEKLPKLCSHLEANDVDLSLFTFTWFLTVFVDNVPVTTFLRIWDAFMYEGSKVLFRFALAFFKYKEEDLLKLKDSMGIHRYMRTIGEQMVDTNRIAQVAFHDINPFPMKNIATKRTHHLMQVKIELDELDAIREDFRSHQIPQDRQEFYSDDEV